jgi:hypothetical protein
MAQRFTFGANQWRINLTNNGSPADRLRGLRFYRALLIHEARKSAAATNDSRQEAREPMESTYSKAPPPAMPALPTDAYSIAYRQVCDHPEAVRSSSTITIADFFGRSETWVIESFWLEGAATCFVQRMSSEGGFRLLLPPAVTTAIDGQRGRTIAGKRKRTARNVVAARRARGEALGNPAALRKARAARAAAPALGSWTPGRPAAPKRRRGRTRKSAAPPAEAPAAAPKRRGRPPGSKNRPKAAEAP